MTAGSASGPQSLRRTAGGVLRGAVLLAAAQILSRLFTLVFTLVIARLMSVEGFGALSLALSTVVVFALIQDLGISRTVVKEVARRPETAADWTGGLVPLKLALATVAAIAMPALAALAGFGAETVALLAVAAFMLPSAAIWLLLENATQAVGAIRVLAGITMANAALQAGLGLAAALAGGGDPIMLVGALAAANILSTGLLWRLLARRIGSIVPRLELAFALRTLRASLPYLGVALAVAALGRIELLLVARLAGEAEAGLFAAAFKIFEAALFVLYATQIAMNPTLARLVADDPAGLGRWLDWELGAVVACIVPACAGAYLLADWVIGLLYPDAYAEAGDVLAVLVAALPLVALQVFTAGVLNLTDRQGAMLVVNLVVMAAQVVLALLLVPRFGALGGALSLALSQALAAAIGLLLVGRWLVGAAAFAGCARALAASLAALAAGFAIRVFAGDLPGVIGACVALAIALPVVRLRLMPPH